MIREEQIENAAFHYSIKASEDSWDRPDWEDVEWAFEVGAEWADTHPNWHKWTEEKPENEISYLCYTKGGFYVVAEFRNGSWIDMSDNFDIIGYMELPETPKFD